MKKFFKILAILSATAVVMAMLAGLAACGNPQQSNLPGQTGGVQQEPEKPEAELPTKSKIVEARRSAKEDTTQSYDFILAITGDFGVLGLGTALNGVYDGKYRYDTQTEEVCFMRTTSGALLSDSTAYVFSSGDNRIKMTMKDNEIKKLSVELPEEQNITMINLPVVAIVDSVKEENIKEISKAEVASNYSYTCSFTFDKGNPALNLLNKVAEKLGTGISFKGVDFSLNQNTFDFNINDGKINDFKFGFQMNVEVKAVKVAVKFVYEQKSSNAKINIPNSSDSGIIYTENDILKHVNDINAAIDDLRDDPTYALHIVAENEFDPGWSKTAVKDSYEAKMYKNTVDNTAWFNHSYCYKSHSESDGKESYKYTLGNVNGEDESNQGTWLISRKSTNTQTKADGVTADTQFDFLTSMVKLQPDEVDCIKKQTKENVTTFTVQLGRTGAEKVQKRIIDMINTNKYGDVIAVNNYFNSDNIINDAEIEIVMSNGKIVSVMCRTELCYNPIGGEYTEYNITLNNLIKLEVNKEKELEAARGYTAPTKVKGNIIGWGKNLNDSEFYIL